MKDEIKELIFKYKVQQKTIGDLILHKDTTQKEKVVFEACKRFIDQFVNDLKKIKL